MMISVNDEIMKGQVAMVNSNSMVNTKAYEFISEDDLVPIGGTW